VFIEQVDDAGHRFGPHSDEVKQRIKEVDGALVRLLDDLGESTNINLMLFSDHGMGERLGGPDNATLGLINVADYSDPFDWKHAAGSDSAPGLMIWPLSGKEDEVSSIRDVKRRCRVASYFKIAKLYTDF